MSKETFGTDASMMRDDLDHNNNSDLIQQPDSETKQLIQEEKPPTQAAEGLFSKLKTAKKI